MTAELPPLGFEVPIGGCLLIRADPFGPTALETSAKKDFVKRQADAETKGTQSPVDYRISVYARRRKAHQPTQEFFEGLVKHALQYLPGTSKVAPVTETELNDAEFFLDLSEPPDDHYDIVLGVDLQNLRSQELSDMFKTHERIKVR